MSWEDWGIHEFGPPAPPRNRDTSRCTASDAYATKAQQCHDAGYGCPWCPPAPRPTFDFVKWAEENGATIIGPDDYPPPQPGEIVPLPSEGYGFPQDVPLAVRHEHEWVDTTVLEDDERVEICAAAGCSETRRVPR